MKSLSRARLFATPWTVACTKLLRPWDFLGKSTGVGCRFLLQGIFPTQGSNPGLPHCRQTFYHLSHQGICGKIQKRFIELTHWKRLWCWQVLGAGGEGDDRGWDSWMASLTRLMWVWVNSGSWWWTGRPGVLQFMGSQKVGHNWVAEVNWTKYTLKW